jgi:hypothetical protein
MRRVLLMILALLTSCKTGDVEYKYPKNDIERKRE